MSIFQIKRTQLFQVAGRWIVENQPLDLMYATPSRKHFEGGSEQTSIGNDFQRDVDQGADATAEDNDPKPISIRTAPDEVDDGDGLKDQAIRHQIKESSHSLPRIVIGGKWHHRDFAYLFGLRT